MYMDRDSLVRHLVAISYTRNDIDFARDTFRVRGDVVEVIPSNQSDRAIRVEFFDEEIDRVSEINIVTGEVLRTLSYAAIYPATHYAVSDAKREAALAEIEQEMKERVAFFTANHQLLEAQRIEERTKYDLLRRGKLLPCAFRPTGRFHAIYVAGLFP